MLVLLILFVPNVVENSTVILDRNTFGKFLSYPHNTIFIILNFQFESRTFHGHIYRNTFGKFLSYPHNTIFIILNFQFEKQDISWSQRLL